MSVLELSKIAQGCQRNWLEDRKMPEKDIDYIIEACTTMPTKQNKNTYSLCAITDRKLIDKLFQHSYDPDDYDRTYRKNTQVRGNLLLVWYDGPESIQADDPKTVDINLGISAGGAALAAVELGYKTGFCRCFVNDKVAETLLPYIGKLKDGKRIKLMLGIGYGVPQLERNIMLIDGEEKGFKLTYSKNVKVTKI